MGQEGRPQLTRRQCVCSLMQEKQTQTSVIFIARPAQPLAWSSSLRGEQGAAAFSPG